MGEIPLGLDKQPIDTAQARGDRKEFPKDFEGRLNALIAVTNIPLKGVLLYLMPSLGYIPTDSLAERFRGLVRGTPMEHTAESTVKSYCESLSRNGVATEYALDHFGVSQVVGFGLTEEGKIYGRLATALALLYEVRHKRCLYTVLGQTPTVAIEGKRTGYLRAQTVRLLFNNGNPRDARADDIEKALGIKYHSVTEGVLDALRVTGVIDYDPLQNATGKTQVTYKRGILPISETIKRHRYISAAIQDHIKRVCDELAQQEKPITAINVFSALPEEIRNKFNDKLLRNRISGYLSLLATDDSDGFLERTQFHGKKVESAAKLTPFGVDLAQDFIEPLALLAQDKAEQAGAAYATVSEDLGVYARNSAELYFPHSKSEEKAKKKENISRVAEALLQSAKGLSHRDLAEVTGFKAETIAGRYIPALRNDPRYIVDVEIRNGVRIYKIFLSQKT